MEGKHGRGLAGHGSDDTEQIWSMLQLLQWAELFQWSVCVTVLSERGRKM